MSNAGRRLVLVTAFVSAATMLAGCSTTDAPKDELAMSEPVIVPDSILEPSLLKLGDLPERFRQDPDSESRDTSSFDAAVEEGVKLLADCSTMNLPEWYLDVNVTKTYGVEGPRFVAEDDGTYLFLGSSVSTTTLPSPAVLLMKNEPDCMIASLRPALDIFASNAKGSLGPITATAMDSDSFGDGDLAVIVRTTITAEGSETPLQLLFVDSVRGDILLSFSAMAIGSTISQDMVEFLAPIATSRASQAAAAVDLYLKK